MHSDIHVLHSRRRPSRSTFQRAAFLLTYFLSPSQQQHAAILLPTAPTPNPLPSRGALLEQIAVAFYLHHRIPLILALLHLVGTRFRASPLSMPSPSFALQHFLTLTPLVYKPLPSSARPQTKHPYCRVPPASRIRPPAARRPQPPARPRRGAGRDPGSRRGRAGQPHSQHREGRLRTPSAELPSRHAGGAARRLRQLPACRGAYNSQPPALTLCGAGLAPRPGRPLAAPPTPLPLGRAAGTGPCSPRALKARPGAVRCGPPSVLRAARPGHAGGCAVLCPRLCS